MANISTTKTDFKYTVNVKTGSTVTYARSYEVANTAGDNTEFQAARLTLANEAAHDISIGEIASFDHLILIASEDMDNVYLDNAGTVQLIAKDASFVAMSGLGSETELRIDLAGAQGEVTIDMMLISDE